MNALISNIPSTVRALAIITIFASMFTLLFLSMQHDALTFDELAHIPAGYSYLTQQDYRLNPEHPPLAKDIAAFPLLFLDLTFLTNNETWLQNNEAPPWWVQFNMGNSFLYHSFNNPVSIIFWSRLAMVFLTLALGAFLYFWARKLLGAWGGLAALALFAFSPSFLAHGKFVTTDVASALGILVALYFWIAFLKQQTKWSIAKAGAALALAFLLKFSATLLIPFFIVITITYALLHKESVGAIPTLGKYTGKSLLVGIVALVFIIPVYSLHILNYPAERQQRDTIADLQPGGITLYEQPIIWMANPPVAAPVFRPFAQFARGVLMATQRGQFGNTVFFLGDIKAGGFWHYFPLIYLFKIPLVFHILTALGIFGVVWSLKKQWYRGLKNVFLTWWIKKHFTYFALDLFVGAYLLLAILGNLNIGIRHLLPILPLLYILVVWGIRELLSHIQTNRLKHGIIAGVAALFVWYGAFAFVAFPNYIPYYNVLAGGTEEGYKVAVDSNYDWGQDFYKLLTFVDDNNIQTLHLDYFGGEDPVYWLGNVYKKLDPYNPPQEGWVAVSANQLQGGLAKPVAGFDQQTDFYNWLSNHKPVARAGISIFIYHLSQ